jgi:hypothetical protein
MERDIQFALTSSFEYEGGSGVHVVEFAATKERLTILHRYPEGLPDTVSMPVEQLDRCIEFLVWLKRLVDADGSR